ncbi:MAG: hypothetical protein JNM17_07640 [Archangium sp.]|nr:hypothetical protein [Archangium sp.]
MGGGDDEDPKRELERLERDLAAIDARWASEGYQQRTTSQVLDDERKTHRELTKRIAQLRGLPPPLTPAAGTVALNVGSAWRPLAVSEVREETEGDPLPAFDVDGEPEQPLLLADLERELHDLLSSAWGNERQAVPSVRLAPLSRRYRNTPGAPRLLSSAWRTIGGSAHKNGIHWKRTVISDVPARLVKHPLLTEADELPDEVTGLTATQTVLMRVLRSCAPETGRFVPAKEVLAEVQSSSDLDDLTFTREVALLGHPSLRRLPLVAFQGFSGRFSATPSFTHVRLTRVGREVIDGTFPLPNLLLNGARGKGTCLLPMNPLELANACLAVLEDRRTRWPDAVRGFDLPDGTQSNQLAHFNALQVGNSSLSWHRGTLEPQMSRTDYKCRIVVSALPWPMTFADVVPALQTLLSDGELEGVTGFTEESSANQVRFTIDIEHIAFLRPLEQELRACGLFDAKYAIAATASTRRGAPRGLVELIETFIESRKQAARRRLSSDTGTFAVEAHKAEAVFIALQMIDRVQAVLREALSDEEGEEALLNCFRDEDRAVIENLPAPPSHDYATGFSREQARHLVKKRKLRSVPIEAARTDWLRARERTEDSSETRADDDQIFSLVRQEFRRAIERFAGEARQSDFIY